MTSPDNIISIYVSVLILLSNIYLALFPVTYLTVDLPILTASINILGINLLPFDIFHSTEITLVTLASYYSSDLYANAYLGFLSTYRSNYNVVIITIPSI